MTNTKKCKDCNEVKTLEEFYKNSLSADGRHYMCKKCAHIRNGKWTKKNRDKDSEAHRDYYHRNIERQREVHLQARHKRRALLGGSDSQSTREVTTELLMLVHEGICAICLKECSREEASIDHITPLSKGGSHTWNNVQLAHLTCNKKKGAKT